MKISPEKIWEKYQKGVNYNNSINLYENVKLQENFYLGKQWEGLNAPDLEKPVLNFLGRVVTYFIAMIVADDIGVNLKSFKDTTYDDMLAQQVERVIERSKAKVLNRDVIRNAAVDGDAALLVRFDTDIETGQMAQGDIALDLIDNTDLIFGNPYIDTVQDQPYIIVVKRSNVGQVRREAKKLGVKNWQDIMPDSMHDFMTKEYSDNDLVSVLFYFYRDEDGLVHFCKTTQNVVLKEDTALGYKFYPIAYMNWQKIKNSYHGNPAITKGVIHNQIYVNTMWALFMIHCKRTAFPKTFIDGSKIKHWTNKVGEVVKTIGNPNEAIATSYRTQDFSQQALQIVEQTINYTRDFMGASDAALGNVKPDNTSAIIAVQKASAAPLELQRLAFYQFVEDYVRIILDIMRVDYGVREVRADVNGQPVVSLVDFSQIPIDAMELNIDIGAASYWSELTQIQTTDNLFAKGIITDAITYLESIPSGYIKNKENIIKDLQQKQQMAQMQQPMLPQANQPV